MGAKAIGHRAVIEQLGDNTVLAAALGLTDGAVCRWKYRGIPPVYWPKIARLARRAGVKLSVEDLEARSPSTKLRHCG